MLNEQKYKGVLKEYVQYVFDVKGIKEYVHYVFAVERIKQHVHYIFVVEGIKMTIFGDVIEVQSKQKMLEDEIVSRCAVSSGGKLSKTKQQQKATLQSVAQTASSSRQTQNQKQIIITEFLYQSI